MKSKKNKKRHLEMCLQRVCWNNNTRINPNTQAAQHHCVVFIAVCRPWTNISINMTQCTIDGHKDCKCSNYFYEMQHYGYINFCKILFTCMIFWNAVKIKSWHKLKDPFRMFFCVIYCGFIFPFNHTVCLDEALKDIQYKAILMCVSLALRLQYLNIIN